MISRNYIQKDGQGQQQRPKDFCMSKFFSCKSSFVASGRQKQNIMEFKIKFVVLIVICVLLFKCVLAQSKGQSQSVDVDSRIFGADKLTKDEFKFPWLVALHHRFLRSFFCAGSLISEKHVLSGKT